MINNYEFVTFTRRTEDPKLAWLEGRLAMAGIPHRRNGSSFHAPILEVPKDRLDDAWAILDPVEDIPDDEPFWEADPDGCSCGPSEDGPCRGCLVMIEVRRISGCRK